MEFLDLHRQYQQLKDEINQNIQTVLNSTNFISGVEVAQFERQLADYVGVKHCISCGNGTDALTLALMAYDIRMGDAVFVPTFTFFASAEIVAALGATPIFVDVEKDTFNISAEDLECAVLDVLQKGNLKPRAVIAVDLFGLPANYKSIDKVAEKYNLLVVEDGAQGLGGDIHGKKSCSFGDIATTSFFPSKPLGCYGDGGAVFTNEDSVHDYIRSLCVHGKGADKYDNVRIGMNSRLDTIQAAILIPKLRAFREYELEARQRIAALYNEHLGNICSRQYIPNGFVSSYAQFSILLSSAQQRENLYEGLRNRNIPVMVYYRKTLHQQIVFRNNPSIYRAFPNANEICKTVLSLPFDPYKSEEEIISISLIVKEILS